MSDNTAPAPSNELAELKAQFSELLTELRKPTLPAKASPAITEVKDNAEDGAFKSLAANLRAIKDSSAGERVHPRLAKLAQEFKAATGLNEGVGSEGGFLLEPTITREVLMPMRTPETSPFASRARKLPVSNGSNSGWINGVDETSRATGSRWGGIQGYRLAEAAQKTASKPTFRRLSWALKKYAVLMYATDELLQDAAMVAEVFRMGAGEELTFMLNDDILNGNGAAGPNGILNSNSLVTVAKASGQAAATFVNKNISAMWQALHPRFRANAAWFINSEVEPQLDELTLPAGTGGLEPRYVTFGPDGVTRIKGKPVIVTEFNAALGTVGDVVLANLDDYLLWERGPEFASSIHLRFDYDESVFRAVYRCDGLTATPKLTPYKGSVQQSAFVALATRS